MKTLVNVRAARRLADCMQAALTQFSFQYVDRLKVRTPLTEPGWKRWTREAFDLNERQLD